MPPPTPTLDFKNLEKREGGLHWGTVKKADTWSTLRVPPAGTVHMMLGVLRGAILHGQLLFISSLIFLSLNLPGSLEM